MAAKHKLGETAGGGTTSSKKARPAASPVPTPPMLIRRMSSTTLGMLVLGEMEKGIPEGMGTDFNADFNEYVKQAGGDEWHTKVFCQAVDGSYAAAAGSSAASSASSSSFAEADMDM